jgi:Flp pilus assembly pilin Flp
MPGPTDKRAVGFAVGLARGVVALALRMFGGDEVRTSVALRIKIRHYRLKEDGVSILEYVLLVALVAMVATGTLLYLGRGTTSPSHVANNVGDNVSVGKNVSQGAAGDPPIGVSADAYWCTSGQSNCTDPIQVSGTEQIQFTLSGGTAPYSYTLQGQQSFMSLDPAKRIINIHPNSCKDAGNYPISLTVTDSATPPDTGTLTFTLDVAPC